VTHTFADSIKYICKTIKSSFLPAFLLLLTLVAFYAQNPFEFTLSQIFYGIFLTISGISLAFLYITNQSKPFFSFLLGAIVFLSINWLKKTYGQDLPMRYEYICICFVLPLNLLIFYLLPPCRLRSDYGKIVVIIMLAEMALIQHFGMYVSLIPYLNVAWEAMPLWAVIVWLVCLSVLAINISFKNTVINTGLFYADCAMFIGLVYASSSSGISLFGLSFAVILCLVTMLDLCYRYRHDYLENVSSFNTYLSRAATKFLFKYSVCVFCIDNRQKVIEQIGEKNISVLEQMLINKISEFPYETEFYRYNDKELMMVFKENAKHSQEYCENIRRTIAASEFVFKSGKTVKITISICISEKTRKYIDALVVAERGHSGLQKGQRFNSNISTIVT